nr:hypothetical protein Iba_chr06bCG2830 [Ipomoea batatas]
MGFGTGCHDDGWTRMLGDPGHAESYHNLVECEVSVHLIAIYGGYREGNVYGCATAAVYQAVKPLRVDLSRWWLRYNDISFISWKLLLTVRISYANQDGMQYEVPTYPVSLICHLCTVVPDIYNQYLLKVGAFIGSYSLDDAADGREDIKVEAAFSRDGTSGRDGRLVANISQDGFGWLWIFGGGANGEEEFSATFSWLRRRRLRRRPGDVLAAADRNCLRRTLRRRLRGCGQRRPLPSRGDGDAAADSDSCVPPRGDGDPVTPSAATALCFGNGRGKAARHFSSAVPNLS